MASQKYIHTPLSTDGNEIRVLVLRPGKWHDEISCDLKVVSLDTNPVFEALSYVWGDPNDTSPVRLDNRAFEVTKNLEAALRRLRKKECDRVIWIDQLCINQVDLEEKSKQVAFMPQIYKSCKEVFLWLGEIGIVDELTVEEASAEGFQAKGLSEAGMGIIREFASGKHMYDLPCFQVVDGATLETSPAFATGFEAMNLITKLPYWDRAWIVQEKILPPKATMILGSGSLPWESVIKASTNYTQHTLSCCRLLGDTLDLATKNMLLLFFSKIIRVNNIASLRISAGSHLIDLLRATRSRRASDDRDKVFAVLGLVTEWFEGTPLYPDYTLTRVQVYSQVTEYLIRSMGGSLVVLMGNHLRRPEIPSWIPDWAADDHSDYPFEIGWGEAFYGYYNASSTKPANARLHGDSIMLLDGYFVDRIIAIGDPMETHDWKGVVPILDSWMKLADVEQNGKKPYVGGGTLENALWRCLIGNLSYNGKPMDSTGSSYEVARPEEYAIFELWKKEIKTAVAGQWMMGSETLSLQMVVPMTARHRMLFITEKGYFGIGPLATRVGDEVHVLLGSNLPSVTRAVEVPADIEPLDPVAKTYALVGECYVHGIMGGEIVAAEASVKETLALC